MSNRILPEGQLIHTTENQVACASLTALQRAMELELILEGHTILCTAEHDLIVSVGTFTGRIAREEAALGIREGTTREIAILSRVGKPISFTVIGIDLQGEAPMLHLSRRRAQEIALAHLLKLPRGSILPAVVTHMEQFGAFVDIGCGFISMIGIENISVSRISHPNRRFSLGQDIHVVMTGADPQQKRILLSHKELLGTWAENAALFTPGMTVPGYVRGIKEYGIFVELTPNLTGLSDYTPQLREDDRVSVFIKAILPEKMKVKLMVIQRLDSNQSLPKLHYMIHDEPLSNWCYTPTPCQVNEGINSESPLCF